MKTTPATKIHDLPDYLPLAVIANQNAPKLPREIAAAIDAIAKGVE
jgi:hypothetical protein